MMLEELKKQSAFTLTENGALTYATTLSSCLDLFACIGASRGDRFHLRQTFLRACIEDRDAAVRLLFYSRDVRGGLGERETFRVLLKDLATLYPMSVRKNLSLIPEYGRYDDLLCLLDTPLKADVVALIQRTLAADLAAEDGKLTLLAKWLPSPNASSKETVKQAKHLARALGMKEEEYRRCLSGLRRRLSILENALREKDYTFDYEKQASRAMLKYRKAFLRNDKERYLEFLNQVQEGKKTLHTKTLYPYDIVHAAVPNGFGFFGLDGELPSEEETLSLDTAWRSLPDYTADGENAIVVVDGSGSMYASLVGVRPVDVAVSLALYFAERNQGPFRNHFITFSETPKLVEVKGANIVEKARYAFSYNEVANTNIDRVFRLILNAAVSGGAKQEELPSRIYIISDMEFDMCAEGAEITNFKKASRLFERAGYRLPEVVFWNVNCRHGHQPVSMNDRGVALVSGFTPRLFSMVTSGDLSPYTAMMEVLSSPRYRDITG